MKLFRALALSGTILAWMLALLGSWTRINSAGMTCPDWPLCRGAVVPALQGGVVLEWTHRLLALLLTLLVAAIVIIGWRLRKRIPGLVGLLGALVAALVLQVALGGVTIFAANSPPSVTLHWGAAMLLLSALTALTVVAFANPNGTARFAWRTGTWALLVAAAWGFLTMCAGAFVSSSGAGLACPSFPGCGPGFFGSGGPQAAQMGHRFLALIFAIFAVSAAFLVPATARRATIAVRIGLCLLALQIGLGIANVLTGMPAPLREAHAANAGLTFLSFIVAALLASLDESPVPAESQTSRRAGDARPAVG